MLAQSAILLKYGYVCTYQGLGNKNIKMEYEVLEAAMDAYEQCAQKYAVCFYII